MNCNEVMDNLSLYLDDELDEEEKILMDEHLKNCPECSRELEEYRKVIRLLNELPDEEPPAGYCKRLHEKLLNVKLDDTPDKDNETEISKVTRITEKRSRKFGWVKFAGLAAALVMVLLVYNLNNGGLMGRSGSEMYYSTTEEAKAPQAAPMENSSAQMGGNGSSADYSMADQQKLKSTAFRGVSEEESTGLIGLMSANEKEMKIIKTGSLYVQTKDYGKFLDEMAAKIEALGGYIENNNTQVYQVYDNEKLMHGNLKIRVPQESFYETVSYLEEVTEIRSKNINESDVTKEYYEKDNKVKNLEVQEQHLRELFEKATTVEEMLQIENELNRVRTDIDELNLSLADIDDRASMSTIDLEVEEVKDVNFTLKSEKGVWERAKEGFISTVNSIVRETGNLVVRLISSSPVLIPAIIVLVILLVRIKKYWKKKL